MLVSCHTFDFFPARETVITQQVIYTRNPLVVTDFNLVAAMPESIDLNEIVYEMVGYYALMPVNNVC